MPIPEAQLETWSHQGAIAQSRDTYRTIKNALEASGSPYATKNYSVFLQGSYGNDTNIYAESDVDVVIVLNDCWQTDLRELSDDEKAAYKRSVVDAAYTHVHFKADVISALTTQFGSDVSAGSKAIAIASRNGRRKADVIAAVQFRRYYSFRSSADQRYEQGICFYSADGTRIANYPKQHSANLTAKHQSTGKWLKPLARVFKNARSRLVDDGRIMAGLAPSYFIEGMLYNAPDSAFGLSYQDSVENLLNWLHSDEGKESWVCANQQYYLLRDSAHVCWPSDNFNQFLEATIDLWNEW